jgi:hypothetical protein
MGSKTRPDGNAQRLADITASPVAAASLLHMANGADILPMRPGTLAASS